MKTLCRLCKRPLKSHDKHEDCNRCIESKHYLNGARKRNQDQDMPKPKFLIDNIVVVNAESQDESMYFLGKVYSQYKIKQSYFHKEVGWLYLLGVRWFPESEILYRL